MKPELVVKPLKKFGLEIEEGGICRKQAVRSKLCILKHTHTPHKKTSQGQNVFSCSWKQFIREEPGRYM